MWGWICAGLAVVVLVGWIILRGNLYRRLFATGHFLEVAREVPRLKAAALGKVIVTEEDHIQGPTDPRAWVSSAGLVIVYTIRLAEDQFIHHYSVSVAGGLTAHAVGETFVLFVARLLGVPFEALALGLGRSMIHHAEFRLSAEEEAEFATRPVPELSEDDVSAFREEWLEARKHLRWHRLQA